LSIGYLREVISVAQPGALPAPVVLRASAVQLPEVTVRANGEAEELVRRCYAKLLRHEADVQYGRGFYRQKTSEDGRYREIFDAFYDLKITPRNMPSWVLGEARYALTPGAMAVNNFSIYTRLLPRFLSPAGGAIKSGIPLSPNAVERFSFVLRHTQRSPGREVAVIDYKPRSTEAQAVSGTLYIDAQNAALYRIEKDMPAKGMLTSNSPAVEITGYALRIVTDYTAQNDSLTRVASTQAVTAARVHYFFLFLCARVRSAHAGPEIPGHPPGSG
ncbi:MAG TPA: hypothetical protein VF630_11625, partial [Hymenobacter sp.]